MDFKKKSLIALLVISVFLLSSCEVYQTLYGNTAQVTTGNVVAENESAPQEVAPSETSVETETPIETETPVETQPTSEQPIIVNEGQKEKPVVIVVQETDLVDLIPKATDPDNDKLAFTFTSPVNEEGKWQTNYGDVGEYTVTVTVSDGQLATARDVLIIVNKKEESPTIDVWRPLESALTIDETQSIDFSVQASDLNKDPLAYSWKLDGDETSNTNEYTYQSDYDSAGSHTVKVEISDGTSSVSQLWSVNVRNVNRKPVLDSLADIKAKETDKITITAVATDADNDIITYSISDNRFKQEDNAFAWQTDYDSAGSYDVTVSASDGQDTTSQTIKVDVENVNRPPVIVDILQKA